MQKEEAVKWEAKCLKRYVAGQEHTPIGREKENEHEWQTKKEEEKKTRKESENK